ncbi:MAG TPA: hypothetical protein VF008_18960 [Niastella sp.]
MAIPFFLSCAFFVKNETVNGIKGNTQGVNNAIKPPSIPIKNIPARLLPPVSSSPQGLTGFFRSKDSTLIFEVEATPPSSGAEKAYAFSG